ncbi:MAG: hypothetical protein ACJASQ_000440 [Crocinitomicaceae bacterium]|jgi:hypothetical protein
MLFIFSSCGTGKLKKVRVESKKTENVSESYFSEHVKKEDKVHDESQSKLYRVQEKITTSDELKINDVNEGDNEPIVLETEHKELLVTSNEKEKTQKLSEIKSEEVNTTKPSKVVKKFNWTHWALFGLLVSSFFLIVLGDILGGFLLAALIAALIWGVAISLSIIQKFKFSRSIPENERDKRYKRKLLFANIVFWSLAAFGPILIGLGIFFIATA